MEFEKKSEAIRDFLDLLKRMIPSDQAAMVLWTSPDKVILKEAVPPWASKEKEDMAIKIVQSSLKEERILYLELPVPARNLHPRKGSRIDELENILCLPFPLDDGMKGAILLERERSLGPYSSFQGDLLGDFSRPLKRILGNFFGSPKRKHRNPASLSPHHSLPLFIGQSEFSEKVLKLTEKVKDSHAPVFLSGESGTGKELVAKIIHFSGSRKNGEFVAMNCGAVPENLLESELFGYRKGSFTGAVRDKVGLIEEANGGTFFLDEIGDLSLHLQAKLLRLLQEKEIRRIGENRVRRMNVRFISATNKNIEEEVAHGRFRKDLYYRLKIVAIHLPSLRERKTDILSLLNHYIEKYSKEMGRDRVSFSLQAVELLTNYSWPGNVRELQNEIQRCLILCGDEDCIQAEHLSPKIKGSGEIQNEAPFDYCRAKSEFEKRFVHQALVHFNYNRTRTAEEIGLSRQGLFKLMKKHRIRVPKSGPSDQGFQEF